MDAAAQDVFYASGKRDLAWVEACLAHNGLALGPDMTGIDFGCGAGRVCEWLAARCGRLLAFDISAAHLRRAAVRTSALGLRNVRFRQLRGPDDLSRLAGADLFFCVRVLQHNPPPIVWRILDHAFAGLNPGGIALFGAATSPGGYGFALQPYLEGLDPAWGMEWHLFPDAAVFRLAQHHGLSPLDVPEAAQSGPDGASRTFLFRKA